MGTAISKEKSVNTVLWKQIKSFKAKLNIVENPGVGELTAPTEICELIDDALGRMLSASLSRRCERVRVCCTVDHRRKLHLKVIDDGPKHNIVDQIKLFEVGIKVDNLPRPGSLTIREIPRGPERTCVELIIPLPSH